MTLVLGEDLATTVQVKEAPEGTIPLSRRQAAMVRRLEGFILEFVPDAVRSVEEGLLVYSDAEDRSFLAMKPYDGMLGMFFQRDYGDMHDEYGLLTPLDPKDPKDDFLVYEQPYDGSTVAAEDYIIASLTSMGYFEPEMDMDSEEYWSDYVLRLTNGTYTGPLTDGKAHGQGRFVWDDGGVYEGSFLNGTVSGKGKYTRPNGDVFEGNFVDGRITYRDRDDLDGLGAYVKSDDWKISFDRPPMYM